MRGHESQHPERSANARAAACPENCASRFRRRPASPRTSASTAARGNASVCAAKKRKLSRRITNELLYVSETASPMISFELSEEQRMIRDTVAAFAKDEIRPGARDADETGTISPAIIAKSWELGLVRGAIPEQFGGYGDQRSAVTGAIVGEEPAFRDLSIAPHLLAPRPLAS